MELEQEVLYQSEGVAISARTMVGDVDTFFFRILQVTTESDGDDWCWWRESNPHGLAATGF